MGRKPIGERAMTAAERVRLHRQRHATAKVKPAAPTRDAEIRMASLQRENTTLRQLLDAARAKASKPPKPAKPPPSRDGATAWEDDPRTIRLKAANKRLRERFGAMLAWQNAKMDEVGSMPFATYGAVMRCLHPDSQPTEKQRQEASGLLSQWRQASVKAATTAPATPP